MHSHLRSRARSPHCLLLHAAVGAVAILFLLSFAGTAVAAIADRLTSVSIPHARPLEGSYTAFCLQGALCQLGPRLYVAPVSATTTLVGWTDDQLTGHVARIHGSVTSAILELPATRVRGLTANPDSSFGLLAWELGTGVMRLSQRGATGAVQWSVNLNTGSVGVYDSTVGDARLVHGGGSYCAYFGIKGTVSPFAGHNGEQRTVVSDAGTVASGPTWGVSHSLSAVAGWHAGMGRFGQFAVSDCYPDTGLIADLTQTVVRGAGNCSGSVSMQVGQMAATAGSWLVAFDAVNQPCCDGHGIGLLKLASNYVGTVAWLTGTDGAQERDPVLASLDPLVPANRFVVGWQLKNAGSFLMAVVDSNGVVIEPAEDVTATGAAWGVRADAMRGAPDGSVVWANGTAGANTLTLFRLLPAQPLSVEGGRTAVRLAARPNPFQTSMSILFVLATDAEATVEIYGPDGSRVTVLARGRFAAGTHALRWDGRDARGRAVSPGRYFCRVRAAGADRTVPITRLR